MFIEGNWLHTYTIPYISSQYKYAYTEALYNGLEGGGGLLKKFGNMLDLDKKAK
jgi:hypothetical protein